MMVAKFKERRDVIVKGLNEIPGFSCTLPNGAFYAFPNVKNTGVPSKQLSEMILQEAGVACLDGRGFGSYGEGYLRFSYANSLENIQEALRRIKALSVKWAK
jgi:aspartate/methionine/tyrosine aminotransferase